MAHEAIGVQRALPEGSPMLTRSGRDEAPAGLEGDGCVETDLCRVTDLVRVALNPDEVRLWNPLSCHLVAKDIRRPLRIGESERAVDKEHRSSVEPQIAHVAEHACEPTTVLPEVVVVVSLLHQHLVVLAIPAPSPALVRPAQRERLVEVEVSEEIIDRPAQQPVTAEPVVVVAECPDPVSFRQVELTEPCLAQSQIVEAEFPREVRLLVSGEEWTRSGDVRPLREPWTPPRVVLWDRMELWKVKGDGERARGHVAEDAGRATSRI